MGEKEEGEAQFKAWEKKNAVALHAINISCGTNMLHIIRGIIEANEAWLAIIEIPGFRPFIL